VGGQGVERREILRYLGIAAVASTFPGFDRWAFACPGRHPAVPGTAPRADSYRPLFFSPAHYLLVQRLAEMIIPADDTPGATEAGVAEFIDFMVANRVPVSGSADIRSTDDAVEYGRQAQIRFVGGLHWMNARSQSQHRHEFLDCTPEQQAGLLEALAYRARFTPGTERGRAFFQMMRDYTVVGYYTTKIGLESLGYPGLQVAWPEVPSCPHADDPEHVRLPRPDETAPAQRGRN
jgi:Gluconate 2-dehydrogenase subunit 3